MFWGVDAEEGQAAGQHRPGGFGKREPGTVGGRGFLVTQRKHGVLEDEHRVGGGDEVPGETVGGTVAGGGGEGVRVRGEGVDEVCRVVVLYVAGGAGEAEGGGVAAEGPGAGVGVPDPEEGVGLALDEVVGRNTGMVVRRGVQQRPAGGVAAEGVGSWPAGAGRMLTLRGAGAVGVPWASTLTQRTAAQAGSGSSSQEVRTRAPWERRIRATACAVTAARTSRGWWSCTSSPVGSSTTPYRAPRRRISATRSCAPLPSRVMLRKPGPVMSTPATPSASARCDRRIRATSCGGRPAGRASCRATFVA